MKIKYKSNPTLQTGFLLFFASFKPIFLGKLHPCLAGRRAQAYAHSFKLRNKLIYTLFFLFLFSIPFQTAKHFIFPFSLINQKLIDYYIPTLYLSDVLLLVLFSADWFFFRRKFFIRHAMVDIKKTYQENPALVGFIIFLVWTLITLLFSLNFPAAMYKYLRLIELFGLVLWMKERLCARDIVWVLGAVILPMLIELPLVFAEWYLQRSLGLSWLGEWARSGATANVAEVFLQGQFYLRPYGTFPHPNILAYYLLFVILILLYFFVLESRKVKPAKLGIKSGFVQRLSIINPKLRRWIVVSGLFFGLWFVLWGMVLTFSRVGWTALILGALSFLFIIVRELVNQRGKKTGILTIVGVIALVFLVGWCLPYIIQRFDSLAESDAGSYADRITQIKHAAIVIQRHPFFGVGLNNYIAFQTQSPVGPETFQNPADFYQPVHFTPALIASETGVIGLILISISFILILRRLWRKVINTGKNNQSAKITGALLLSLWLVSIFVSLFDHYLYSLPQGSALFGVLIGLSFIYIADRQDSKTNIA